MRRVVITGLGIVSPSLGCRGLVVWCLEDSHHADRFFRMAGGRDICEGMEDFGEKHLKKIGYIWD